MLFSNMTKQDWFQLFTFIFTGFVIIYFSLKAQGFASIHYLKWWKRSTKPVENYVKKNKQ